MTYGGWYNSSRRFRKATELFKDFIRGVGPDVVFQLTNGHAAPVALPRDGGEEAFNGIQSGGGNEIQKQTSPLAHFFESRLFC